MDERDYIALNKDLNKMKLIENYEKSCNDIVKAFCKKQDIEFDFWVADEVGGIAGFASQYFFNVSDLVLDLKTNQPKGFILDWQSESTEYNMFRSNKKRKNINYNSYIMGLRF